MGRMCSNLCQFQTRFQCQTSSMCRRSRLASGSLRSHRSSQTLCRSLCQHRSQCTSHHRQHLAQLLTPSTLERKEEQWVAWHTVAWHMEEESQLTPGPMAVMVVMAPPLEVTAPLEATQVTEW